MSSLLSHALPALVRSVQFSLREYAQGIRLSPTPIQSTLSRSRSRYKIASSPNLCYERLTEGQQVACVLYRGDYAAINSAYVALHLWLATSGYRLAGPCREIYHRSPLHTDDSASYLTEIQYPIVATQE